MLKTSSLASLALAACVVGGSADVASAALAKKKGLSGLSGKLSSNATIRQQQLICDPAASTDDGTIDPNASALAQGAPRRGSDSVNYDPSMVSLSDVELGTGYAGSGRVEVQTGGRRTLQDLAAFLKKPAGTETGYVQLLFHHGARGNLPPDNLFGPVGEPGQTPVAEGFATNMSDGPVGFDTHSFFFTYKAGVPDTAVAAYDILASGGRSSGSSADFLTGVDVTNHSQEFTIPASQIAAAHVQGALVTVPLPAAVWAGSSTLAAVGLLALVRRRRASGWEVSPAGRSILSSNPGHGLTQGPCPVVSARAPIAPRSHPGGRGNL